MVGKNPSSSTIDSFRVAKPSVATSEDTKKIKRRAVHLSTDRQRSTTVATVVVKEAASIKSFGNERETVEANYNVIFSEETYPVEDDESLDLSMLIGATSNQGNNANRMFKGDVVERTQKATELLCNQQTKHDGITSFEFDPAASLVGNVDPQQPEIGMSVQISRRFRLNRMAGRVMTATPHIVADTTVCVPLANDEPFNEECFTRTIGWLASKDTKTEADLITLLSMDHKVYGTVTEVSLDTDGGQHATVQWWATMRCSHV